MQICAHIYTHTHTHTDVESIDVLLSEDDDFWQTWWEDQKEDFVWGPVSTSKKWVNRLHIFKKRGGSVPQHLRSPDVVDSTGDTEDTETFRAGTWRAVADVQSPVGVVKPNATLLHINQMRGRALGFGQLTQLQVEPQAILVHQIHVYIPND